VVGGLDGADWRRRLTDLGRGAAKPHPPLFAPMLFTAAADIDAINPSEFARDPTKIVKGAAELTRMLGLKVAFTGVPCGMLAEAFGASLDQVTWPPKLVAAPSDDVADLADFENIWPRSPLLSASLESTKRLAGVANGPIVFVALEGPARLCSDLFPNEGLSERTADFAGRALAALLREFAQAGVAALVLVEGEGLGSELWNGAARTIGNVARFHRLPLFAFTVSSAAGSEITPPLIPCFAPGMRPPGPRPYAIVLPKEADNWINADISTLDAKLLTTNGDVLSPGGIETIARRVNELIERLQQV
jgi:hypothetical protein